MQQIWGNTRRFTVERNKMNQQTTAGGGRWGQVLVLLFVAKKYIVKMQPMQTLMFGCSKFEETQEDLEWRETKWISRGRFGGRWGQVVVHLFFAQKLMSFDDGRALCLTMRKVRRIVSHHEEGEEGLETKGELVLHSMGAPCTAAISYQANLVCLFHGSRFSYIWPWCLRMSLHS